MEEKHQKMLFVQNVTYLFILRKKNVFGFFSNFDLCFALFSSTFYLFHQTLPF